MATLQYIADHLDGFAGFAALVNGLMLWPIVRAMKAGHQENTVRLDRHDKRLDKLETS